MSKRGIGNPVNEEERRTIVSLKRACPRLKLREIAAKVGRHPSTVSHVLTDENLGGRVNTTINPRHERPIPKFTPPQTGSASGFIRPIDFRRLVGARA